MRRRRGRNEVHQVELQRLANFLGRAQMPEMNRIKTAAVQSYPHVIDSAPRSGADLSIPAQEVLIGRQFVEPHRPARVQPIGRDSSLSPESEFEAVSETRRRIDINRSRIDLAFKARGGRRVASNDRIGKMR